MSAAADKARFFLEQSVPELKELERKKIFTPEEISAVAKRRSDFEHKINARGSSPADYAQYAEFEINVDMLRRKRIKRLGVKATTHNGQRRMFFVFDRGTRKFPGDLKLWMQSVEYARSQKALKKVTHTLTNALRLHPTKPELWIYAAQFALAENGDMTQARGYMQRGLRFCKNSKDMWLQNFRLEINWIAKIHARRCILGIEKDARKEEEIRLVGADEDMMMLPKLTAQDIAPEEDDHDKVDVTAVANLKSTPVMTGAIPIAIFDAAVEQFHHDADLAFNFHEEIAGLRHIPPIAAIEIHITEVLQEISSSSWQAQACLISIATLGMNQDDPAYPAALRELFRRINRGLAATKQQDDLKEWSIGLLTGLSQGDLDPALQQVLQSKVQALEAAAG
ncbi:U3 snoRNP protein [Exophiala xenobiotica]|uniref:U3 snoRNP protein n=1 Tax=Lithohypha guttulata TaxID=1690604 RepID=A0ABR0KKF2_9EURO|nr:U3 snoRNP protein [Lithohypha guttulata]KAK5328184.1 U3 snoRNP protein [Exophiala xenobiotica]